MGYYSYFSIKPTLKEIRDNYPTSYIYMMEDLDIAYNFEDSWKWYNWETDCLTLSKKVEFPFQITREGEETSDVEIKVFHNGVVRSGWQMSKEDYPTLLSNYLETLNEKSKPRTN